MDVLYFLKQRTSYIRWFYDTASKPFALTIRQIEGEKAPFDNPPYSEDGEPPFFAEWTQANTGLQMLGRASIAMLAASLHLYLRTWETQLGVIWGPGEKANAFKQGWLNGYRNAFGELLHLNWNQCPADFAILEQLVLARNQDQHPDHIANLGVKYLQKDIKRFPQPFFISEADRKRLTDPEFADIGWLTPEIYVSHEGIASALEQVEKLSEWLEPQFLAVRYPYASPRPPETT